MALFNATLVVQMFHFGIAYLIISNFLVAPAVEIIMQEDEKKKLLTEQIERQEERLQEKQRQRHESLQRFHIFCASHVNYLPMGFKIKKPNESSLNLIPLQTSQLTDIKAQLTSLLVSKIRVHDGF